MKGCYHDWVLIEKWYDTTAKKHIYEFYCRFCLEIKQVEWIGK